MTYRVQENDFYDFCVGGAHKTQNFLFFSELQIKFAIVWYACHEYWNSRIWFIANVLKIEHPV